MFPEVEPDLDNTLAIVALLALALIYLAVIFSVGMFVSARTRIPSTSITVLLLLWVAAILAVPNMAPYITSQILPVPSRESVDREKAEIRRQAQGEFQELIEAERERTGSEEVWQDEEFRAQMETYWEEVRNEEQKVEDSFLSKIQGQTRWSAIVARISPLTSFNLAAFDLAAAGLKQEAEFVGALKEYGQTWAT